MLPVGLELVYALHACFATGVVPIPLPVPDDDQWIEEDVVFFVEAVKQFHARVLILNNDVELFLRTSKSFFRHMRALNRINISKAPKSSKVPGGRGGKGQSPLQPIRASPIHVAMIVAHPPNPDNVYPQFVKMSHANILAFCRQMKSDFQMPVNLPVLATTRCYYGYSLMQLALVGVYTGCPTVLLSYQDFYDYPNHWFELLQRYQIKDALATYTMFERAVSKLNHTSTKQFSLHNVRNLSVILDDRAIPAYYTSLAGMFNLNRLDDTVINNIYTHPMNGLISTRAYMGTKPITLRLCLKRLRRGRVVVVDPEDRKAQVVSIQDSGKIASNTMVAIVNPLTRQICVSGEVGEIWVYSMSNAIGYAHKVTPSLTVGTLGRASMDKAATTTRHQHAHRSMGGRHSVVGTLQPSSLMVDHPVQPTEITTTQVMGHIDGGDSQYAYVRTGDLGFLYIDPMSGTSVVNGVPEEPLLFVLGRMNDTFDVNGLTYFVMDVEQTVEKTHQLLENNGSVVFRTRHTTPAHVNLIMVHNNQATLQQQAASAGPLAPASTAHLTAPQRTSMASLPLRGPASGSASGTFDHSQAPGSARCQSHASPFGENMTLAPQDLGEATVQEQERLVVIASVLRYTETDVCHVANLAPLIVNTLLEDHDLVVDEVILLPMGSISKSRTHEKRRARVKEIYEHGSLNILARYVVARDPQ
ncbi:hypothetical protein H4R34_003657 [Dimargaris verticillata]|uniref:AMP-dependent synthetase/ligase domain-containing protein n=1 Tax=Dimargaris verticillata TaxID=2761393 RepID=A0A9W8B5T4_9FUNG|nr:hypothetical protein H4R34_003657 [Dimargaris verticillata]